MTTTDLLAAALRRLLVKRSDPAWYEGIHEDAKAEAEAALAQYDAENP